MTEHRPAADVAPMVEALLFASSEPLPLERMREVLSDEGASDEVLRESIEILRREYADTARAFQIVEVAGGYQVVTLPRFAPCVTRLLTERRKRRLSQAALETLSIVAYRQPVSRAEIEAVRGVAADGLLRSLLEKGLIRIMGRRQSPGRPLIYGTTDEFLRHFGLRALSDLPPLGDLDLSPLEEAMETAAEEIVEAGRTAGLAPGSAEADADTGQATVGDDGSAPGTV